MTSFHELSTDQQVDRLNVLKLSDLLTVYRTYFPGAAEHPRSYMQRKVAYRVQELAYGGVDAVTANKSKEALRDLKDAAPGARLVNRTPVCGTRLTRIYRGQRYDVIVCDGFFEYAGKRYESLGSIAKEIAGTRQNGWVFFGLGAAQKAVKA
jgi:hypothetical protein